MELARTIFASATLWRLFRNRMRNETEMQTQFQLLRTLATTHGTKVVYVSLYNLRWDIVKRVNHDQRPTE